MFFREQIPATLFLIFSLHRENNQSSAHYVQERSLLETFRRTEYLQEPDKEKRARVQDVSTLWHLKTVKG